MLLAGNERERLMELADAKNGARSKLFELFRQWDEDESHVVYVLKPHFRSKAFARVSIEARKPDGSTTPVRTGELVCTGNMWEVVDASW